MAIPPKLPDFHFPHTYCSQADAPPPSASSARIFSESFGMSSLEAPSFPASSRSYSESPRIPFSYIHKKTVLIAKHLNERCEAPIPPVLFPVLAQAYYNQYEPIDPDSNILIAALAEKDLLELCLIAIQHLMDEKSRLISTEVFSTFTLKLGLQLIKQSSLQNDFDEEYLQTFPPEKQNKLIQVKKAIESILTASLQQQFEQVRDLAEESKLALASKNSTNLTLPTLAISLEQLQLLMMWIQGAIVEQDAEAILAGAREEDPAGKLYQFTVHTYKKLKKQKTAPELLPSLLDFIDYWKAAPANYELLNEAEAGSVLYAQEKPKLTKEPSAFFKRGPVPSLDLSKLKNEEPPLFHWKSDLTKDSVLFYLLSGKEIKVTDLVNYRPMADPLNAVSIQIKRFNQIIQFFTNQLFDKRHTLQTVQKMVGTLQRAEKKLLAKGAFEAARALRVVFDQAAIKRLEEVFQTRFFFPFFKDPEPWCSPEGKFQKLKSLQNTHEHPFESLSLVLNMLMQTREIPKLTDLGELHLDRLKLLGDIFNQFILRKASLHKFWASADLQPDSFLLECFAKQTGKLEEEEDAWWERSQEIHTLHSTHYWGKRKMDREGVRRAILGVKTPPKEEI